MRGLQGEGGLGNGIGAASTYVTDTHTRVVSQAKHFAMYGKRVRVEGGGEGEGEGEGKGEGKGERIA